MNRKSEIRSARSSRFKLAQGAKSLGTPFVALLIAVAVPEHAASATIGERPPMDSATEATPMYHGSVFADPLGFALFGPRLGVELGSRNMSGSVYGRWMNEGLLSHSMFLNSGDTFAFSYGAGLRGRYYLASGLRDLHVGLALEYIKTKVETPSILIATNSAYGVPQFEAGYRVPVGGFYVDGSGAVGYAFRASGSVENLPGGTSAASYEASNASKFYAALSLELGVYF